MSAAPALLSLGHLSGLHGVRGALRVHLHHEGPSSLASGMTVYLCEAVAEQVGGAGRAPARLEPVHRLVVVRFAAPTSGRVGRIWLDGVDSVERATPLVGLEIFVDRGDVVVESDEYLIADLIGLDVVEQRGDQVRALGRAVAVTTNGAQDLLEVEYSEGETWLLPLIPGFVERIDQSLWVSLPEDFLPDSLERTLAKRTSS